MAQHVHEQHWSGLAESRRAAWVGFLRVHKQVISELDRELQVACGLSMSAYDVLVQLSIAKGGSRQMHELADAVLLSRSALTRRVARLEQPATSFAGPVSATCARSSPSSRPPAWICSAR